MHRPNKFHTFCAFAILSSLLAGLITYRYLPRQERPLAGARPQNAAVMPLVASLNAAEAQEQTRLQVEAGYGKLPLAFEPNRGQTDPRVKFLSRAGNRMLWLTADEAVLAVGRTPRPMGPDAKKAAAVKENQIAPAVLRMKFVGANTSPTIEGEARQPGTVNYFAGKSDQWRTKIPIYARVRYRSLYSGIDLVFYGNNRELEYDLVVAPGADPGQIRLALTGADEIRIDAEGNLVLKTSQGEVIQQKPRIYQRSGATLKAVSGDYVITGKDEVGFRLGSYDRRAAVVIDPVLRYSTFLGGSDVDTGNAIAVDSSKRAVVVGFTCSQNFPVTDGTKPLDVGQCASFITKFDFTGSHLIFTSFFGGNSTSISAVALDSSDNIYVTGIQFGDILGFPITPGAFKSKFVGGDEAFVAKLNAGGTKLVYSTLLGGSAEDHAFAIAVDTAGNAYVTGNTSSTDFPATPGAFQRECKLGVGVVGDPVCFNAFVSKLNSSGSQLLYATFLGGSSDALQEGNAIAVDLEGQAFVAGSTAASDFPTTAGSAQPVLPGGPCTGEFCAVHGFVANLSSSGSHLVYSTFLGGGGGDFDRANGIALDMSGNAFVTGITGSIDFPVKNAFQSRCPSFECAFVTKLSPNGRLVYSTVLGGGGKASSDGSAIAVTPDGQAYVTGLTSSRSFPTTQTAFQRVFSGTTTDGFITKFNPAGGLVYSSYLGTAGDLRVALDRDTNAYVAGTVGPSFLVTPSAFQQQFGGGERDAKDAFVAKVVSLCALSTVNRSVTICSPGNGSTVASPVRIIAGTTDVTPVKLTQVYLDGKKIYETPLSAINVGLPIAGGTHRLTVQGLDTANVFFKKAISINVSPH
ncbi:MAG: SBBP repeat-containing protein [Acidobacteriia bacterium]|nr:SBBP repeat-containing protein [Terriglobia bacterium]